jgi:hypothetical protein
MFSFSGLLLLFLAFIRDRRVWFGLAAATLVMIPLLFLPGRLFEAYAYLPLACAAIAIGAAASHVNPAWAWILLVVWIPFNVRQIRHERRATLDGDDRIFSYVNGLAGWVRQNPGVKVFVYEGVPPGFHNWGVTAAWSILHRQVDMPAHYFDSPEAAKALASEPVAYGKWDPRKEQVIVSLRVPRN